MFFYYWQATLGVREDGIMTVDLQERLFGSDTGLTRTEEHELTEPEKVCSIACLIILFILILTEAASLRYLFCFTIL